MHHASRAEETGFREAHQERPRTVKAPSKEALALLSKRQVEQDDSMHGTEDSIAGEEES